MNPKHIEIAPFAIPSHPKTVSGIQRAVFFFLFLLVPSGLLTAGWYLFSLVPSQKTPSFYVEIERFSGSVEIYSHQKKQWRLLTRKSQKQTAIKSGDKIRTGKEADIDFEVPGPFRYRLKEDSELQVEKNDSGMTVLKLERGSFLGTTNGELKEFMQIETNQWNARFKEAAFLVRSPDAEHSFLDVLEGKMDISAAGLSKPVSVGEFQHWSAGEGETNLFAPATINLHDWKALNEIRDISVISVQEEKEQIHLREGAGNLFQYVFDEGAFYTPNFGFAKRTFYEHPKTKKATLRLDYDVFPPASYSGMYVKTRGLDLSKFQRFSFKLKGDFKKPLPDEMRIEFKSKRAVLFSFIVRPKPDDEDFYAFPLKPENPAAISEITFVIEHQKVAPHHLNGAVLLEELSFE